MKIGLVQSRAVRGDLSGNLRRVVQGVRACMDAGAELAVAGAAALDGVDYGFHPGGDESYRLQARAALAALAEELSIPLILASRAAEPGEAVDTPRPYLLCCGEVQLLPNHALAQVGEQSVWIDVGEQPLPPPPGTTCDTGLHLPTARWHLGQDWAETARAEAAAFPHTVLIAQCVGCSDGQLQAGASAAAAPGAERPLQLPFFCEAEAVYPPEAATASTPPATMAAALLYCLRETLLQSGAAGYAIAQETATAPLLQALVERAVGTERCTLLPRQAEPECDALQSRLCGALLTTWAEDHDHILLNPLTRNRILLGDYTAPATLHGCFAPLADLWESALIALWAELLPDTPCPLAAADEELLRALLTQSPLRYLNTPSEPTALRLHRKLAQAPQHSWPRACRM